MYQINTTKLNMSKTIVHYLHLTKGRCLNDMLYRSCNYIYSFFHYKHVLQMKTVSWPELQNNLKIPLYIKCDGRKHTHTLKIVLCLLLQKHSS